MHINPNVALYVKLGSGGQWEKECIEARQTIRFGYREVNHDDCVRGKWDRVRDQLRRLRQDKGSATRDLTQVRHFYEAGNDVLWLTFFGNHLWWAFSEPRVAVLPDNSKERPVVGKWSNLDAHGKPLSADRLRGGLVAVQGFRGTICVVKERDYVISKINGSTPPQVDRAQEARRELIERATTLVQGLHPKDFELLVDLLFRESGWKRLGVLGRAQKTVDLELVSAITNERMLVQVKSRASLAVYRDYKTRFADIGGYAKSFFVVHTPEPSLASHRPGPDEPRILGPRELATLCLDYGLVDWLIAKAE